MRDLSQWLADYGESHQNPINQKIHKVAVPGIFLSVVGLIWSIPPIALYGIILNWVWVVAVPVLIFYFKLSLSVFLMMLGFILACISLIWSIELMQAPVFLVSLVLFAVLWMLQFIGHKIEGKKPSFLDDVMFLLIGPVWVFRKR
ncbi:putative PRS2 protein [Vibrio sinaloensis DSM 21326]|uniref:Putative PRS2 protein n=1 Tax=Vibrio sinaloensis DSM 21326 TaxID=945550 RepID=E8M1H6_PHOS4|nr:Mpo1-like protein [Vibrio sinaloensis]EGA72156.1 putative PRS2 protein [Vibrio sinaloensis DSM 21326]